MFLRRDFDGIIEFLVGSARTVWTAIQLVRGECVPIGPWGVRSNWPVGSAFQLARGECVPIGPWGVRSNWPVGGAFQLARGECVPIGPWGVRSSWPVGAGLQPAQIRAPLATGMFPFNVPRIPQAASLRPRVLLEGDLPKMTFP
jgi:hypothetical protein